MLQGVGMSVSNVRDCRLVAVICAQVVGLVSGFFYLRQVGRRFKIPIDQTPLEAGVVFPSIGEMILFFLCAGSLLSSLFLTLWIWFRPTPPRKR